MAAAISYSSTGQILPPAGLIAADLLTQDDKDDDGIPLLKPISCGRDGQEPLIIRLPTLCDEANKIAELLSDAHQEGHAWGDMAVICRDYATMDACAHALSQRRLPHHVRKRAGDYRQLHQAFCLLDMTMQAAHSRLNS